MHEVLLAAANMKKKPVSYLGLYDDPPRPGRYQVERGLIQRNGAKEPAYGLQTGLKLYPV